MDTATRIYTRSEAEQQLTAMGFTYQPTQLVRGRWVGGVWTHPDGRKGRLRCRSGRIAQPGEQASAEQGIAYSLAVPAQPGTLSLPPEIPVLPVADRG